MPLSAPIPLELLAPARTAEIGIAAVTHGADAVYIGGPAFGARAAAGNTVADIERLARTAHRFGAQVFVALNTILRDDELAAARDMAWSVYHAGADALIIQDVGLLELDLPPLALHASTQMDNRTPEKVRFLQDVGFSQVVLARELTLAEIRAVADRTDAGCVLEFFIHGALCVSYSGQCSISHALTGRSANRGECAQLCRLPYGLADSDGELIARDKHLLSLKDNDQSDNLAALIEAGIRSFKIEGRLKDVAYVKNLTAWYRQRLDAFIDRHPGYRRASAGRCTFRFTPDPDKTFNRGRTDYFVNDRRADLGAFDTPKFAGEALGTVLAARPGRIDLCSPTPLANGDGLSFFAGDGALTGVRVNTVSPGGNGVQRLSVAADAPLPTAGQAVYRNLDHAFARQLEGDSAERRIAVDVTFAGQGNDWRVVLRDETGIAADAPLARPDGPYDTARDPAAAGERLRQQLARLGGTDFLARRVEVPADGLPHLPAAAVNAARRDAVAALAAARAAAWQRPPRRPAQEPPPAYPLRELTYLGNVFNAAARAFYRRHGVELIADAYECNTEAGEVSLMITRHCLRYSFNRCPKQVRGIKPTPMTLISGKDRLTLRFDCKRCEMHVIGKRRAGGAPVIPIVPVSPKAPR